MLRYHRRRGQRCALLAAKGSPVLGWEASSRDVESSLVGKVYVIFPFRFSPHAKLVFSRLDSSTRGQVATASYAPRLVLFLPRWTCPSAFVVDGWLYPNSSSMTPFLDPWKVWNAPPGIPSLPGRLNAHVRQWDLEGCETGTSSCLSQQSGLTTLCCQIPDPVINDGDSWIR